MSNVEILKNYFLTIKIDRDMDCEILYIKFTLTNKGYRIYNVDNFVCNHPHAFFIKKIESLSPQLC